MAQSGYTPILIYGSTSAGNVPLAADLTNNSGGCELAINVADGKLYYKDSGGVVQVIADKTGTGVKTFSAGTTGLTPSTASTGAITLAGTLITSNGGTGLSSYTAGDIVYYASGTALSKLGIGTANYFLSSSGSAPQWTQTLGVANGGTGLNSLTAGRIPYGAGTSAFGNSANLFWDSGNNRLGINTATPAVTAALVGTDAILIPKGTTAQQPTGVAGYLRFNTDTNQFEGYNGTAWASVGGSAISNDTSTASNLYPIFVTATTGTALNVYTSNAKYLYKPSTGELQASEMVATNGLFVNATTIAASYTIQSGYNAQSVGPVTIASGQSVTVTSGQRWLVY